MEDPPRQRQDRARASAISAPGRARAGPANRSSFEEAELSSTSSKEPSAHHVKKIRARDGKVIWSTSVGDVIKGTPTFYRYRQRQLPKSATSSSSAAGPWIRAGPVVHGTAHSLHGISFATGKKLWRHNTRRTASNSRDCDASALIIGSKACVPLENGYFTVFSPRARDARTDRRLPRTLRSTNNTSSTAKPIVRSTAPSSAANPLPTLIGSKAYVAAGCRPPLRLWHRDFSAAPAGASISEATSTAPCPSPMTSTSSSASRKEFIPGQGGVMKVKPGGGVKWFYPTPAPKKKFYTWERGPRRLAHRQSPQQLRTSQKTSPASSMSEPASPSSTTRSSSPAVTVPGPRLKKRFPVPLVLDQVTLPTGSISTPLFVGNKIVIGYDTGMDLYEVTPRQQAQAPRPPQRPHVRRHPHRLERPDLRRLKKRLPLLPRQLNQRSRGVSPRPSPFCRILRKQPL